MENRDLPAAPFSQGVQDIINTLSRKKIFCIQETLIRTFHTSFFYYKITFVNSQH